MFEKMQINKKRPGLAHFFKKATFYFFYLFIGSEVSPLPTIEKLKNNKFSPN